MCMLNLSAMALKRILEMGKRTKDHGRLGFKRGSSETNSPNSTEAAQKGENHYCRNKNPLPALRCYLCRKLAHIRKECIHFLMRQKMRQQVQHSKTKQV